MTSNFLQLIGQVSATGNPYFNIHKISNGGSRASRWQVTGMTLQLCTLQEVRTWISE
jgi:hypothetical protein